MLFPHFLDLEKSSEFNLLISIYITYVNIINISNIKS